MKGIDIFCSSQAATAICSSMEGVSSSSSSIALASPSSSTLLLGGGGRAIDRHNPIIKDSKRYISRAVTPCVSSQSPISPKPHRVSVHKKKLKNANTDKPGDDDKIKSAVRRNWSCTKKPGGEFISPANSARYLLGGGDKVLLRSFSEFEPGFPGEKAVEAAHEPPETKPDSSSSASPQQVVVLRVSLHCRGCEKKMRKHISTMQGVTSFSVDFVAKKVTVTGNITPLEVLSSISKVKNAQLWPPALQASNNVPTANGDVGNSEFKNGYYRGTAVSHQAS